MEGTTFVTTEALRSTANEFNNAMIQVQNLTSNMVDKVNGLAAGFQGEAASAYISKFNALQDDIAKLAAMINEHVKDLNESADNFDRAENINIESANSLKGDIIV